MGMGSTHSRVGWSPYHYGHWAWVEPWGWTWIDDAPWGFAPFHYGRWAMAGGGWVWIPGRLDVARPVYAPALVAFVGGPRFGVSIGVGGGVGMAAWFPLGPGEVYRPSYHVSEVYVRQVNVTHVHDITNITDVTNVRYVNRTAPGGVTVMRTKTFAGAPARRAVRRAGESTGARPRGSGPRRTSSAQPCIRARPRPPAMCGAQLRAAIRGRAVVAKSSATPALPLRRAGAGRARPAPAPGRSAWRAERSTTCRCAGP